MDLGVVQWILTNLGDGTAGHLERASIAVLTHDIAVTASSNMLVEPGVVYVTRHSTSGPVRTRRAVMLGVGLVMTTAPLVGRFFRFLAAWCRDWVGAAGCEYARSFAS